MKRLLAIVAALVVAGALVTGCGQKTAPKSQTPAEASLPPALSPTVPFSHLKASALDTVDFVSDTVGYVGGQGGILKSGDGGKTWLKLYTSQNNIVSVDAVDTANVWAATKDYLLRSIDGRNFRRVDPIINSNQGGKGIQAIDFVNKNQGFLLANGVVWRLNGGVTARKASPGGRVDSISFVDPNTGFAAGGDMVYKTTDGGKSWTRIFTAPVITTAGQNPWRAVIHAGSATNAWLLVYGGDAGMSQMAYVVFHTTDGSGFTPLMYEGYFSGDYPTIHLDNSANIGAQPGPFTVSGDKSAFFVGWYPDQLQLTRTVDNGRSFTRFDIGKGDDTTVPDFFSPMGVGFADTTHGWLVGNQKGQGIILTTTDGGTFKPVP